MQNPGARTSVGLRSLRLKVLLGLLLAVVVAFFGTASMRRQVTQRTEQMRREVAEGERMASEAREARRLRQERLQLLEGLAQDPENVPLLLRAASLYGQDRRYEDAVFLLQEAQRLAPDNVESYRGLYQTCISQSQFDRAYDYAEEGLKHAPRDMELILGLIHLDSLVGWNGPARDLLKRLDGTPDADNPRVHIASALIHRQVTDSRHAEADLTAALAREPQNDKAYALLSGVQWETGKSREAEASIRKALALQPDNPDYLLHLSEIQLRGRTPESIEASRQTAERALQVDPGNRSAFMAIALALLTQKRAAEATGILERMLARYPDDPQASYQLAQLRLRAGRQAEAQQLLTKYAEGVHLADDLKSLTLKVAMVPNSADAHLELGRLYNLTGAYEKAVLVLRRALQLAPGNADARRELARALAATNRSGEYAELVARPGWHIVDPLAAGA
jgi:cytochrome c-type biogenesis protein CcmH/NrfG